MGVRCRDCGRESRLEPQCLVHPSTPLIQLLFSCKSYQHFLLTPTITPHSWALFSLFTAHQGERREKTEETGKIEGGSEKWNISAPFFNQQNSLTPSSKSTSWSDYDLVCCPKHQFSFNILDPSEVRVFLTYIEWPYLYPHTEVDFSGDIVVFGGGETHEANTLFF